MNLHDLTLESICNKGAEEVFQHELKKIIDSIKDPNTPAKDKRKLILEFVFHPNSERNGSQVDLIPSVKLPKMKPVPGHMHLENDKPTCVVEVQQELFAGVKGIK